MAHAQPVEMTAEDVHGFLDVYQALGLTVWIDGGWGVDALLGEQTRPHQDLDIQIQQHEVAPLVERLHELGYVDFPTADRTPYNFVLADPDHRRIDFHVIEVDTLKREVVYGEDERRVSFPAAALSGRGKIGGRAVRCLTAAYQVASHTGYAIGDKDVADVTALCDRFGVALPPEYRARP